MGVLAGVSSVDAECNFRPENTFGKAEVLDVRNFNETRRNKCFPERGRKLGKIVFRFEPEGTSDVLEYIAYFDSMTQCFDTDERPINCATVPLGREIRDVDFIERRRPRSNYRGRGVLTRLFLVP
ncbi:MAG TPA: hypothetical protein VLH08_10905 [Acidobacteriota bacterium]|nr:hypothetical protein [Acidobacteriota bacterium]